jgi:hypothetical protein
LHPAAFRAYLSHPPIENRRPVWVRRLRPKLQEIHEILHQAALIHHSDNSLCWVGQAFRRSANHHSLSIEDLDETLVLAFLNYGERE